MRRNNNDPERSHPLSKPRRGPEPAAHLTHQTPTLLLPIVRHALVVALALAFGVVKQRSTTQRAPAPLTSNAHMSDAAHSLVPLPSTNDRAAQSMWVSIIAESSILYQGTCVPVTAVCCVLSRCYIFYAFALALFAFIAIPQTFSIATEG